MSREEKLLKELLESYWEEKWKEMPDREEIAGEHDFSEDFQNKIRKIGRKRKKKKYLTAAAAAAVLLLFAAVQGNPEVWAIGEEKSEELQMDASGESISEESGEDSGIRGKAMRKQKSMEEQMRQKRGGSLAARKEERSGRF